jgi:exportin-T
MCGTIANSFRDLLPITATLPDPEEVEIDLLTDAVKDSTFDSQLYLYETIGILCSLMFRNPQEETELLMSFVQPLMDDLSSSLSSFTQNQQDLLHVVKTRHIIMALGNVAKGFPDHPQPPVPDGYILPPVNVFSEIGQAILVCLQAMKVFRVVRDAVYHSIRSRY